MTKHSVEITLGDRSWHTTKDRLDQALYHLSEHMQQDMQEKVYAAGTKMGNHLLFGGDTHEGIRFLEKEGFTVTTKEI